MDSNFSFFNQSNSYVHQSYVMKPVVYESIGFKLYQHNHENRISL